MRFRVGLGSVCLRVGAGDSCPADLHKTNFYSTVKDTWSIRKGAVTVITAWSLLTEN